MGNVIDASQSFGKKQSTSKEKLTIQVNEYMDGLREAGRVFPSDFNEGRECFIDAIGEIGNQNSILLGLIALRQMHKEDTSEGKVDILGMVSFADDPYSDPDESPALISAIFTRCVSYPDIAPLLSGSKEVLACLGDSLTAFEPETRIAQVELTRQILANLEDRGWKTVKTVKANKDEAGYARQLDITYQQDQMEVLITIDFEAMKEQSRYLAEIKDRVERHPPSS